MAGTEQLRVGDAERGRVADQLARAHAEGRLTLAEYDERVRAAHGAVVAADLAPLTADLPVPESTSRTADAVGAGDRGSRRAGRQAAALRRAVAVWAAVSVLNLVIWVAVSVGTGGVVSPWWIWVAGPWGAVLALGALAQRAGLPFPAPVPFGCVPHPSRR
ncbi:hypothetical protein GCM10023200_40490 [Actinomycetospora chlora]|uniref:DUF1707 domain-containing protein n=1 Tax=Actinomycetospora chlora TaxID=663608 RepID=A0ABP9BUI7_9PSEU